jgi:mannose-6-phosphate isomerase-like protein (cupin superfamily)
MQVVRIFTGTDNHTHFQEVDLDTFATLAAQVGEGPVRLNQRTSAAAMDFHNAPRRQYVVIMSGHMEIEIGDGSKRTLTAGDVLVAEDLTGKGHITRWMGNQPCVSLAVPLAG